jgi:hypothetical protein
MIPCGTIECTAIKAGASALLTVLFAVFGAEHVSTPDGWDRMAYVSEALATAVFPVTVGVLIGMEVLLIAFAGIPRRLYQVPPVCVPLVTLACAFYLHTLDLGSVAFLGSCFVFLGVMFAVCGFIANYLFIRSPEAPREIA